MVRLSVLLSFNPDHTSFLLLLIRFSVLEAKLSDIGSCYVSIAYSCNGKVKYKSPYSTGASFQAASTKIAYRPVHMGSDIVFRVYARHGLVDSSFFSLVSRQPLAHSSCVSSAFVGRADISTEEILTHHVVPSSSIAGVPMWLQLFSEQVPLATDLFLTDLLFLATFHRKTQKSLIRSCVSHCASCVKKSTL